MKISAIIPVYNRPRELKEAIESAMSQTRPPDEIIVVDDGSIDDTASVAAGFGAPVRYIRQDNQGPAAARNRAAREARGDWLAFLDSDDLWLPEKLAEQEALCQSENRPALIHTDAWIVDGHDVPPDLCPDTTIFSETTPPEGADSLKKYMEASMATPSVMIKRDVFLEAGGFDESFRVNEDADLYIRIFAMGYEAAFVPKPLVIIRNLPEHKKERWIVFFRESLRLQEKNRGLFPKHRALFSEAMARQYRKAFRCALVQASRKEAVRYLLNSFRFSRPTLKELAFVAILVGVREAGRKALVRRWEKLLEIYTQQMRP